VSLKLTYHGQTAVPVELEGLTPEWACGKSLAEIEHFEIFHGNRKIPLAEMFTVTGDPGDYRFDMEGNLAGVHWIGAHMTKGAIHVHGPAGRHVGSEMRGGEIHIDGDAGAWVGAEMHGGVIHVKGNAGHLVGAAYRGSAKGMTDGTILVDGSAGNEIGLAMRRGLIAIGGNAGDMAGFNMIAGTILIFSECGIRPGAGMRRGTIGLFGPTPPLLLPSFRYAATLQPSVVRLMFCNLSARGLRWEESLLATDVEIYQGDFVEAGKGEIWLPAKSAA
jgi:formylmethanofuran dehydrogenase subunit C